MSIVSVDNIQPIGSGTTVTVNSAATLVLNNANSTGVITATTFVGALTGTASGNPTLANGSDNRVITATGANALTGEANLTFDGTKFGVGTASPNRTLSVKSNGGQFSIIDDDDSKGQFYCNAGTVSMWATGGSSIAGNLDFATTPSGGSTATRMQIDSTGTTTFYGDSTGTEQVKIQSSGGGTGIYIGNFQGIDAGDASGRLGVGKNDNALIFTNASGSQIQNFAIGNTDSIPLVFSTANTKRLVITGAGQLQHQSGTGVSYFNGASEYVFGSTSSSPPAGGYESVLQIQGAKTRSALTVAAYMDNAGGPFMTFLSSRSGTVGTLGTKCVNNDNLGGIRFAGDNQTNYSSVALCASIYGKAKSTPADGDTIIAGEIHFETGNSNGGSVTDKMLIQSDGKIRYGLDTMGLPGSIQGGGFMMYADNGGNNITRLTFTGLVSGCYIATIGYYNAAGQGYGGAMFFVSGYQTATYTYDVHEIRRWDGASNSDISGVTKNGSNWYIEITNTHGSYNGGGEVNLYGDAQATFAVTYSQ